MRTLSAVLVAMCLAAVAASAPARAATPGDDGAGVTEGQFRFELKVIDGKVYRFDRKTGALELMTVSETKERVESNTRNEKSQLQRPKDETVKGLEKKNTPPIIDPKSDPHMTLINMESPAVITELHRRNSEPDISDYKKHLSTYQVAYIRNGMIEGNISLKNTGIHKIADMEVTLVVPTADGNAERYRYRLTTENDIPFVTRPPLPGGRLIMFPVKEKAPAGAGASQSHPIHTEITYIRFADE